MEAGEEFLRPTEDIADKNYYGGDVNIQNDGES